MDSPRTAVLIHGCHLQAELHGKDWEDIVWGTDESGKPTLCGRASMGLKVAVEFAAETVIFASGGSERDGVKEGEYTRQRALSFADDLAGLIEYPGGSATFRNYLTEHSVADSASFDTGSEISEALDRCRAAGIERLILVSSPWHLPRCVLEASAQAERMRADGQAVAEVLAVASHGATEGTMVMEPPHRGDRQKHHGPELGRKLHHALGRTSSVEALERDVQAAIDRHFPDAADGAMLST